MSMDSAHSKPAAPKCVGVGGRLFGHSYQPRYTLGAPTVDPTAFNDVFSMVFSSDMAGVIRASQPKTYHGDVCSRCGHVVGAKP